MPRRARIKSESGIYHIILRGTNRQNIFEDEEDNQRFLQALQRAKRISGFELYAYCLMSNHVHILLRIVSEPLDQIMRRLCGSYVYWYNRKHERIGNLFLDRFKSEPVEDDTYFLTALRYIHRNPYKAGLVKDLGNYAWSSYSQYTDYSGNRLQLIDPEFALKIFHIDMYKAVKAFIEFHSAVNDDTCLEIEDSQRLTDLAAGEMIKSIFKVTNGYEIQKFDQTKRDIYLRQLKSKYNLSIRQIERLTGINRGVIYRA